MQLRAMVLAAGGALALGLLMAPTAAAACHIFEVSVDPEAAREGTAVTVTVTRDAAVNPSSVRVRTEDGTATGGQDYEVVDRRIEFTTETSQSFDLQVLQDGAHEGDETFRIVLSEGDGCQVNPNFSYGEASVTITDDDPAPTTAPPATTAPATTAAPTTAPGDEGTTTTESATATTRAAPERGAPTTVTTEPDDGDDPVVDDAALGDDDDDDGGAAAALAAAAVLVVAGAGAYYLYRRSQRPT